MLSITGIPRQGHWMITVHRIQNSLPGLGRHHKSKVQWCTSIMSLLLTLSIEVLVINCPTGSTILFLSNHYSVGVPAGTGAMMPRSISLKKPAFTVSLKWNGTGIGAWRAHGTASSRRWIRPSGPDRNGNSPSLLNAVVANSSSVYSFNLVTFSSVGGYGGHCGRTGSFTKDCKLASTDSCTNWRDDWMQLRKRRFSATHGMGNTGDKIPTSAHAPLLKYIRSTLSQM